MRPGIHRSELSARTDRRHCWRRESARRSRANSPKAARGERGPRRQDRAGHALRTSARPPPPRSPLPLPLAAVAVHVALPPRSADRARGDARNVQCHSAIFASTTLLRQAPRSAVFRPTGKANGRTRGPRACASLIPWEERQPERYTRSRWWPSWSPWTSCSSGATCGSGLRPTSASSSCSARSTSGSCTTPRERDAYAAATSPRR